MIPVLGDVGERGVQFFDLIINQTVFNRHNLGPKDEKSRQLQAQTNKLILRNMVLCFTENVTQTV